jgi:hypothetical protein
LPGALLVTGLGCGEVKDSPSTDAVPSAPDASVGDVPDAPPGEQPDAALAWGALEPVGVDFSGSVNSPNLSGDRLTMYFMAQNAGNDLFDIYFATRDDVLQGFGAPAPLPVVNVVGIQQKYPEVSRDGLELYFSDGQEHIMVATRDNTNVNFGTPTPVGVDGWYSSISDDKRSLYYIHKLDIPRGEVRRISRAAPGQPWSAPSTVSLPVAVQLYASIDISHDELAMLLAPAWSGEGTDGDILVVRRTDRSAAFSMSEKIGEMADGFFYNSARWAGGDTELWVGQNLASAEKPYVSRLR